MIVLESNQNHATAKDTEVCNALPASMGMGGGYVPMVISYGFDSYNQAIEKEVAQPLRSHDGGDTTPKVIVDTLVFDEANITCPTNGNKPKWNDPCHSLTGEAGRAVLIERSAGFKPRNSKDARSIGYEEEKSPTLAADSGACEVGILVRCGKEVAEMSQGLSTRITSRDAEKERE